MITHIKKTSRLRLLVETEPLRIKDDCLVMIQNSIYERHRGK